MYSITQLGVFKRSKYLSIIRINYITLSKFCIIYASSPEYPLYKKWLHRKKNTFILVWGTVIIQLSFTSLHTIYFFFLYLYSISWNSTNISKEKMEVSSLLQFPKNCKILNYIPLKNSIIDIGRTRSYVSYWLFNLCVPWQSFQLKCSTRLCNFPFNIYLNYVLLFLFFWMHICKVVAFLVQFSNDHYWVLKPIMSISWNVYRLL